MKTHFVIYLLLFNLIDIGLQAQTIVSLQFDGKLSASVSAKAGIEKVFNNQLVAILFSDGPLSLTVNFNYKSIEGKTSATIESGTYPDDAAHGFEAIYKPDNTKGGTWSISNNNSSKGRITVTSFDEEKKQMSGTFEAVMMEMMDDNGAFVAGKSTKMITIKGEFKNLAFVKVN